MGPFSLPQVADTPERSAVSGSLGHAALQGCLYCTQVAQSINRRICYRFMPDSPLRTHAEVMDIVDRWPDLPAKDRTSMFKQNQTYGVRRPSLVRTWKSFDMVKGFSVDVMHALDEGVSKMMLDPTVSALSLSRSQRSKMDKLWLQMRVPGHENRKPRSLKQYKQFKAHEIRMFVVHGLPVVTKGILEKDFYKLYCLLSSITWICGLDTVSENQALNLKVELTSHPKLVKIRILIEYFFHRSAKSNFHQIVV